MFSFSTNKRYSQLRNGTRSETRSHVPRSAMGKRHLPGKRGYEARNGLSGHFDVRNLPEWVGAGAPSRGHSQTNVGANTPLAASASLKDADGEGVRRSTLCEVPDAVLKRGTKRSSSRKDFLFFSICKFC